MTTIFMTALILFLTIAVSLFSLNEITKLIEINEKQQKKELKLKQIKDKIAKENELKNLGYKKVKNGWVLR